MKVIKTWVAKKQPQRVVADADEFSDIKDYPVTETKSIERFTEVELTPESFIPLLEESRLPEEILAALEERYMLRPVNNGVATGVITRWLSENIESFTEKNLERIINIDDVFEVTNFVLENLINTSLIRGGMLSPKFIIPLIGESNHVKTTRG